MVSRLLGSKTALLAVLLSAAAISGGCEEPDGAKSSPPVIRANMPSLPKGSREIQPRDPMKDHGEKQRVIVRDSAGVVREIHISYVENISGLITVADDGSKTVRITFADGSVHEGKFLPGQSQPSEARVVANGKLLFEETRSGADTVTSVLNYAGGKAPYLVETRTGNQSDVTIYQVTSAGWQIEEHWSGNERTWLNFKDKAGKLVYSEHPAKGDPLADGTGAERVGTVYAPDGQPTHRVLLTDPSSRRPGRIHRIDTLGPDGQPAASTGQLDDFRIPVPLGQIADQAELTKMRKLEVTAYAQAQLFRERLLSNLNWALND